MEFISISINREFMKIYLLQVMLLMAFSIQAQTSTSLFDINVPYEMGDPKATLDEVRQLIMDNYYDANLTENDLYWAAIKGMLKHISPPDNPNLAAIWSPEEYDNILNSLKGEAVSIGIKSSFNANDGSLTVTEIEEESPAYGVLQIHDRILRINGESLKSLSITEINGYLKGNPGTSVNLTINRDIEILEVNVQRERFNVQNLRVSIIPNTLTGLVEIAKIYQGLAEELEAELLQLQSQNITKLILDLRNNGGGVLNEGVRTANLFLERNNIIVRTLKRSNQPQPIVADRDEPFEFEIIVLINQNTASASEIIASALQDHRVATVIGSKTFGKGVIETTYTLSNDYRVKFITNAMYRPTGTSWQSRGVLPDFLVEQDLNHYNALKNLPVAERAARDIYLITAIKLLR